MRPGSPLSRSRGHLWCSFYPEITENEDDELADTSRDSLCLIALALTGPLFTVGIVLRGPVDITDTSSLVERALTPGFSVGWALIVFGFVLQLYGFFGLYRYLTSQSDSLIVLLGLMLRIVGGALGVPAFMFLAINGGVIAERRAQGDPSALTLVERFFEVGLGFAILAVASSAAVVGFILFVVAMWRTRKLPRWTVTLFTLSLPLLAIAVTFLTELLGAIFWMVSTAFIAWKGWRDAESVA